MTRLITDSAAAAESAAITAALEAGARHHQAGALEQAEALYSQVLAQDPGNAHALPVKGDWDSVIARFAQALSEWSASANSMGAPPRANL